MIAHINNAPIRYLVGAGGVSDQAKMACEVTTAVDTGTVAGLIGVANLSLAEIVIVEQPRYKARVAADVGGIPVERATLLNINTRLSTLNVAV